MTRKTNVEFTWNQEDCSQQPFNLAATLASGQNFRWRRDLQGIWWGTIEATVVAVWQAQAQPDSPLHWQTFPHSDQQSLIRDYFRLDVDLPRLYADWSRGDIRIQQGLARFRGLRLLRQPPHECLFAFQCATCNTVLKIERSVAHLARHYGLPVETGLSHPPDFPEALSTRALSAGVLPVGVLPVGVLPVGLLSPGSLPTGALPRTQFYAFPTLQALAQAEESVLRSGLWGYRAPRIIALAKHLQTLPPNWLLSLRQQPYAQAHAALTSLFGIGAKLADCICLFALDNDQAVPVDTHIRQIALSLFAPELADKSLTPRVYNAIAEAYRQRFGGYAGWAQQYLFFDSLRRAPDFACL